MANIATHRRVFLTVVASEADIPLPRSRYATSTSSRRAIEGRDGRPAAGQHGRMSWQMKSSLKIDTCSHFVPLARPNDARNPACTTTSPWRFDDRAEMRDAHRALVAAVGRRVAS